MKIQLIQICYARSGDKGDTANIGLIARRPEYFAVIKKYVTAEKVRNYFDEMVLGTVERFELPNLGALNFLLHNALGGGGTMSLKNDAQGKTLAAALLKMELEISESLQV